MTIRMKIDCVDYFETGHQKEQRHSFILLQVSYLNVNSILAFGCLCYKLMFQSADIKLYSIHTEVNSSGDVHVSPTKKNVQAHLHLDQRTRKAETDG